MVKCDKNKKGRIAARNLRKRGETYNEIKGVVKVARLQGGGWRDRKRRAAIQYT